MPPRWRNRCFLLPQGRPVSQHFLFFSDYIYLPADRKKAYQTKQRHRIAIKLTHCCVSFLRSSLTSQRAFFYKTDFCLWHSSLMPAANDWKVVTFRFNSFLQRSSSFSLVSAIPVQHNNESWHFRQRAYLTNTYNLNSYDGELLSGLLCSRKIPYRNIARRSPLLFSIFLQQTVCTPGQSIKEKNQWDEISQGGQERGGSGVQNRSHLLRSFPFLTLPSHL